jgi:hypothetical protein
MEGREFTLLLFVPMMVWIGLIIALFVLLLVKYTLSRKGGHKLHRDQTFAMPPGIFRGILTLSVLFAVLLLQVVGVRFLAEEGSAWLRFQDAIDPLVVAFQMILSFYFGAKIIGHLADVDRDKSRDRIRTALANQPGTAEQSLFHDPDAVG